jgi:hypothetical protein
MKQSSDKSGSASKPARDDTASVTASRAHAAGDEVPAEQSESEEVQRLFAEALELEPGARVAFVEQASADNPPLKRELLDLLLASEGAQERGFLQHAPAQDSATAALKPWQSLTRPKDPKIEGYEPLVEIGAGPQGSVYLARNSKDPGKLVTILLDKAVVQADGPGPLSRQEDSIRRTLREQSQLGCVDQGTTANGQAYCVLDNVDFILGHGFQFAGAMLLSVGDTFAASEPLRKARLILEKLRLKLPADRYLREAMAENYRSQGLLCKSRALGEERDPATQARFLRKAIQWYESSLRVGFEGHPTTAASVKGAIAECQHQLGKLGGGPTEGRRRIDWLVRRIVSRRGRRE